jgi:hypothetical protein
LGKGEPIATVGGGRPYGSARGRWAHGRRLLAEAGFWETAERLATYPHSPWVRFGWGPIVGVARRVAGTTQFEGPQGPLRYEGTLGERTVELAVAREFVAQRRALGPILEVGNVLAHHVPFPHPVVDRYEPGDGILHVDVLEYRPSDPSPSIVSISTLEHVGFDETPRRVGRFRPALVHLFEQCLRPGGTMLVTVPLGYNPEVDDAVFSRARELGKITIYRRHGLRNLWDRLVPSEWPKQSDVPPYSFRRHHASLVAIALARRD